MAIRVTMTFWRTNEERAGRFPGRFPLLHSITIKNCLLVFEVLASWFCQEANSWQLYSTAQMEDQIAGATKSDFPVGQHYEVATSGHCYKSVLVLR